MIRTGISIAVACAAGIAAPFLFPPTWLGPLSAGAAICAAIFALIIRLTTKEQPPANPIAGAVLLALNLPDQPFAKVKQGWALMIFLASASFLVAIGLTVIFRAQG